MRAALADVTAAVALALPAALADVAVADARGHAQGAPPGNAARERCQFLRNYHPGNRMHGLSGSAAPEDA
jgi:hypothetical protein